MAKTLEEKLVVAYALAYLYSEDFGMPVEEVLPVDEIRRLDSAANTFVPDEEEAISITRELFRKYASEVLAEAREREC